MFCARTRMAHILLTCFHAQAHAILQCCDSRQSKPQPLNLKLKLKKNGNANGAQSSRPPPPTFMVRQKNPTIVPCRSAVATIDCTAYVSGWTKGFSQSNMRFVLCMASSRRPSRPSDGVFVLSPFGQALGGSYIHRMWSGSFEIMLRGLGCFGGGSSSKKKAEAN